jgi:hypothetical protein
LIVSVSYHPQHCSQIIHSPLFALPLHQHYDLQTMDEPMKCTHNNTRVVVGYRAPADLECHYTYANDENENDPIRWLSVNDPSVSDLRLRLGEDASTEWMTQTGHSISKSHFIRRLDCWNDYSDAFETSEDLSNFCKHLAQNRSIQHLTLRHFQHEQLMILAPVFEHNCHHLRCIEISDAGMWKGISPPILNLLKSKSSELICVTIKFRKRIQLNLSIH